MAGRTGRGEEGGEGHGRVTGRVRQIRASIGEMNRFFRLPLPSLALGSLLVFLGVTAAACGTTTATPVSTSAAPGTRSVVHLTAADAGQKFDVPVGGHVEVVLDSTYWSFQPVTPQGILTVDSGPRVAPLLGHCVPGEGCGTVTIDYTATGPGNATVEATRTTCGEALRCRPGQGHLRFVVMVPVG